MVGPAVAHHGWGVEAYDELAGAVVAGHVLECGTQATGGNFSGFRQLLALGVDPTLPLGFPLAEIAADGSCVITKHDGTGGAVTVDTVTAQLVYEVQSTRYLGPDVTTHLDSLSLAQVGPDRVAITGVRGEAPPARLKVCVNELGGFRNSVELVLTGLDIEAKADWVRAQLDAALAARPPAEVVWSRPAVPAADADTEEGASVLLRCTVKDPSPDPVGRPFTAAAVELALGSYPGFTMTAPPGSPTPFGVYRAEYVDRSVVEHTVVHADGSVEVVADPPVVHPATGRRQRGAPVAVPRPLRRDHPAPAARDLRPRALRRQGRRRQHRALGRPRRARGPVCRTRRVAEQADQPQPRALAGPGGGRPRRRGLPAAQPRRGQRARSTGCSATAWPRRPGSTRRPRGSASGCARGTSRSRTDCCERAAEREERAGCVASSG